MDEEVWNGGELNEDEDFEGSSEDSASDARDSGGSQEADEDSSVETVVDDASVGVSDDSGGSEGASDPGGVSFTDEQFVELLEAISGDGGEEDGDDAEEEEDLEEAEEEEDEEAAGVGGETEEEDDLIYEDEAESYAEVPEDFYQLIADLETQQTFYQSLVFGLLVFLCFCIGLKK